MKKQAYQTPKTTTFDIALQSLLAGSGPENVYSDEKDGISKEEQILSRHTNLWDDDEEDF